MDKPESVANVASLAAIVDCARDLGRMLREYTASSQQSLDQCDQADQALLGSLVNITTAMGALDEIRKNGEKIAEIVEIVRDIAFQSRILSLNAAVEAAHAGETGKGFAVVAEEVRRLAQRSAEASRGIKQLTGEILATIQTGSEAVDNTAGDIAGIRGHVEATKTTMDTLVAGVAAHEARIEQLLQAVANLDQGVP